MAASLAKSSGGLRSFLYHVVQSRCLLQALQTPNPAFAATPSTNIAQVRFRNKTQRVREAKVDVAKERKFIAQKGKKKNKGPSVTLGSQETSAILADAPVDNVWIRKFYPQPRFSIDEAIKRHKAFAQPAMLDNMGGLLYLDMRLDFTTKKKTKFLSNVRSVLRLPHEFPYGEPPNILVICKNEESLKLASSLGAKHVGSPEDVVKMINTGVINPKDFDHVLCTSDCGNEISSLRQHFRDKFPQRGKGNLGPDMQAMWELFYYGYVYESSKITEAVGKLQVPIGFMEQPTEDLVENFKTFVDHICKHRSIALGPFIKSMLLFAPPSPEEFLVRCEEYVPGYQNEEVDSDEEEAAEAAAE